MADLQEAGLKLVAEGADAFESAIDGVGGVLASFGNIALDAASMAADALGSFFADSFSGALEAEQTIARLGQVIESTGGAAGITVKDAEALADQFKDLAGGSDDAVLSIIDMGLRMGTVSEDMMPSFIQSTLDLGAIMGDTGKASQVMSRAIEDPVGTLGALRKAGILVNEETEAQIKAMVKSGDTAGAYALLMDRVGEATEGAAETMANTTAGQWAIFQETIADAGESIVGAFLPAIMGIAGPILDTVVPAITALADTLVYAIGIFTETGSITEAVNSLGDFPWEDIFPQFVADAIYNGIAAFEQAPAVFASVQAALQPVIDAATNLANAFIESMPMIQATVQVMADFVIAQFNALSPTLIANVSSTLDSIATFWREHGDEIMAVVTIAFEFITVTIGTALTAISGLVAAGLALVNGDTTSAMDILQSTFTVIMDNILSLVGTDLDGFVASWTGTFAMVEDIVNIGIAAVGDFLLGGLQAAIDSAQMIVADVGEIGQALIDNIADGITNSIATLINAATEAATAAYNAILDALHMHSPSPLLIGIGADVDDSLAMGLDKNIGTVMDAAMSVAKAMISPPMSASVMGAQYAYSNTSNVTNNLSVHTDKPMTTIAGEFAVMQTLYGGSI